MIEYSVIALFFIISAAITTWLLKDKWSVIMSISGILIASTITFPSNADQYENIDAEEQSILKDAAFNFMYHPNLGVVSMCDKIFDEKLNFITYGTLTSNGGNTRFPALIANYDFGCVNPITGDRDRENDFWVILGHDDIAETYRCIKIAGKPVIDSMADNCEFRPEE